MEASESVERVAPKSWAALAGVWEFDESVASNQKNAIYQGPSTDTVRQPRGPGLALSDIHMRSGEVACDVALPTAEAAGRIVFGHDVRTGAYYSVGIGGGAFAYVLDIFEPGRGWRPLAVGGEPQNLRAQRRYRVRMDVRGQNVSLRVDDVTVIEAQLPVPLLGDQLGVIAWGQAPVEFAGFTTYPQRPSVFVVMQFAEPYNSLYLEVIKPVCHRAGLTAFRADEVYKPGVILQDIIAGLTESEIIIAEITPTNANVFYELGYAHALEKPTILLAERDHELPFDVRSYRVIFYDDSIAGAPNVTRDLERHLDYLGFPPIRTTGRRSSKLP